jgi:hypothetical protein
MPEFQDDVGHAFRVSNAEWHDRAYHNASHYHISGKFRRELLKPRPDPPLSLRRDWSLLVDSAGHRDDLEQVFFPERARERRKNESAAFPYGCPPWAGTRPKCVVS